MAAMASPTQQPSEASTMFETVGPHFFSQVFIVEEDKGRVDDPDASPCEKYLVELSATSLGLLNLDDTENVQPKKIASADITMMETRFQKSEDNFKSCIIKQLHVETGGSLTDMGAFAAILRRIQSLCIEERAEHLAMTGAESYRWPSGLLKKAEFNLCECDLLYKGVRAKFQLCMDLPTPRGDSPASRNEDSSTYGRSIDESDGVVVAANNSPAANNGPAANNSPPAANIADIGYSFVRQKTHCSLWIFKGECAFTQVGCKYKHEIPLTQAEFDKIELRKVPHWFKHSEYWSQWLQQVNPEELEGLITGVRNVDISTAQPSGQHSGRWRANNASSRGGGNAATTTRGPAGFEPYTGQRSYEDHYHNSIESNIGVGASHAGTSSATKIGNTQAVNTRASRRPDREIYRPPGRAGRSGGSGQ